MTAIEKWWHETLTRGTILPDYLAWATQPERHSWPEIVSSVALHASMSIYIQAHGTRLIPNATLLALNLNKFLGGYKLIRCYRYFDDPMADGIPMPAHNLGQRQYAVVNMPNLEICRKQFDAYLGQQLEWPEEDETQPQQEDKF